jgi:hypothetical protein
MDLMTVVNECGGGCGWAGCVVDLRQSRLVEMTRLKAAFPELQAR